MGLGQGMMDMTASGAVGLLGYHHLLLQGPDGGEAAEKGVAQGGCCRVGQSKRLGQARGIAPAVQQALQHGCHLGDRSNGVLRPRDALFTMALVPGSHRQLWCPVSYAVMGE